MKELLFNRRKVLLGLSIMLALCTLKMDIYAQSTLNAIWPNGRYLSSGSGAGLYDFNDSLVMVFSGLDTGATSYFHILFYRKSDLSKKSEIIKMIGSDQSRATLALSKSDTGYFVFLSTYLNQAYHFGVYGVNQNLKTLIPFFEDSMQTTLKTVNAGVFENELYLFRSNFNDVTWDTTLLEVYDLQGNLLRSKRHSDSLQIINSNQLLSNVFSFGPYQDPNHADRIVYGNEYKCQTVSVNKQTLEIEYYMPKEQTLAYYYYDYGSTYLYGYYLYPDRVVCGGHVFLAYDLPLNAKFDWEYYFNSRNWQGDSLYENHYGVIGRNEQAYAFTAAPAQDKYILAGANPFYGIVFSAAEYRQVVIYQFNEQGVTDSLVLFGNKNHVPVQLHSDPNGDLFMLSMFSESWTTGSTFYQLTKIPAFVIGLVEQKLVKKQLIVYPNPTQDIVQLAQFEGNVKNVSVYTQSGALVLQQQGESNAINISKLPSGMYVIVVDAGEKGSFAGTVVKQ